MLESYNRANPFKDDDSFSDEVLELTKGVVEPELLYNEVQERDLYETTEEIMDHILKMGGYKDEVEEPEAEEDETKNKFVIYYCY